MQPTPQVAPAPSPLGLYLHVPFCATACDFCAFYTAEPRREDLDRYLAAMEAELALRPPDRPVDTVFWGGGTPSLLPARDLERLGRAMLAAIPGPTPAEWTVELAPSTVKADKLAVLRDLGVSRVSIGVQSFSERWLDALGRRHAPAMVHKALGLVREAGFASMNLDLMFALPGQTLAEFDADVDAALAWRPDHVSTYCLTFEDDTALWVKLRRGEVRARSAEEEGAFYSRAWERLGEAGLPAYEVSNAARPGHACRHNLNTWAMAEWIGYGPSAASQWRGRRWANVADLARWQEGILAGHPAEQDIVPLSPALLAADCLVFGLRRVDGVDLAALASRFPGLDLAPLDPLWERLADEGLLARDGTRLALTVQGRLLADGIGTAILEAWEG